MAVHFEIKSKRLKYGNNTAARIINMFETLRELTAEIERLKVCLALAQEVGWYWRNNWSDFDGRTLRDQMENLRLVADGEWTGTEYRENWGLHA